MRNNRFSLAILLFAMQFIIVACAKNRRSDIIGFAERKLSLEKTDSCIIDLREVFNVEFDTMYVFDEYTQLEGIRLIIGKPTFVDRNIVMPTEILVEDGHQKVILLHNNSVVFNEDLIATFKDSAVIVAKKGSFDGEPFLHKGRMYASPFFKVERMGSLENPSYILKYVPRFAPN